MDANLRTSLRWALGIAGVLGAACALTLAPYAFGTVTRDPMVGLSFVESRFPLWARWQVTPNALALLIAGALCALLFVAGRLGSRLFSAVFLASLVVYYWALRSGGYWRNWMTLQGKATPFAVGASVLFVGYLVETVLAFWNMRRLGRETSVEQSLRADAQ